MRKNEIERFDGISQEKLEEILAGIGKVRVGLIGDLCLDVYWRADMTKSELSRETPHFPLPVVEEWMSPGAGGNAAANIAALEPAKLTVLGVLGADWRGDCLLREFRKRGVDTGHILTGGRITDAYCKPLRKGISGVEYEDPRLDFGNYEPLPAEVEKLLGEALERMAGEIDILCVSDQFRYGCVTPEIREKIVCLAGQGLRVVVDSRDRIGLYSRAILKPNAVEGLRAVYPDRIPERAALSEWAEAAGILAEKNCARVCMTLGSKGCIFYAAGRGAVHIPSREVKPPVDTVGAGDCFLSAFSCALAAGAEAWEAAAFANMAADVIVKKIGTTGTAAPGEIRERHREILRIDSRCM